MLAATMVCASGAAAQTATPVPPQAGLPGSESSVVANDRSPGPAPMQVAPAYPATYPANAAGYGPRAGFYFVSRWAEDWRFLANPPAGYKGDTLDALKYIPIAAGGQIYLTLSDEERFRVNYTTSPGLRSGQNQDQELIRNVIGADIHLGPHLRLYGEINGSEESGANTGTISALQRNDTIFQQAFVEGRAQLLGATAGVIYGRQEFQDGPPSLLFTLRAANNVYTVFNGARLYANWRKVRVFAVDFRTTSYQLGSFDDAVLHGEKLKGGGASIVVPPVGGSRLFFDPLFYRYDNNAKKWGSAVGDEQRSIYGARLWGAIGALTVDLTAIHQDGTFRGREIDATATSVTMEYQLSPDGVRPRIGFHSDYASGGGAYGTGKLRDYNYLYGSIPYYSNGNFVAPINLLTIAPVARINPTPRLRWSVEAEILRRPNQFDGVYTNVGTYAGTQRVRGHDTGVLYRSDLLWSISRHWQAVAYFEYLNSGAVLARAGFGDSQFYGGAVTFRF